MPFLDETGLVLQPLARRTWAPRGRRPVMYCRDRRDRLGVIAGLTPSARRRRVGLYFAVHRRNIKTPGVLALVRRVQREIGRPLVVVMDRLSARRSAAKALAEDERLTLEWLPAHAPDLNPVEPAWSRTKYSDLANYVPRDAWDLGVEAELALETTASSQTLLRSFFQAARLKLN